MRSWFQDVCLKTPNVVLSRVADIIKCDRKGTALESLGASMGLFGRLETILAISVSRLQLKVESLTTHPDGNEVGTERIV